MNPKIKRRLKAYNDRHKDHGFEMEINGGHVYLNYGNTDFCDLICGLSIINNKKRFHLTLFPVSFCLNGPGIISDFLYYGMAILEEINKEFKANHNNGEGNGNKII